jgi:hypothetical protein
MSLDPVRYKKYILHDFGHGHSIGLYYDTTNNAFVIAVKGTVIAQLSSTQLLPVISGEAQGDLLLRGASNWAASSFKASGQIPVGNGTTLASVAVSGDATLASNGALTIANDAITSPKIAADIIQVATGSITAADIIATDADKFGHANGYPLVAAPGAGYVVEFISGVVVYDFDTAAYTDGGDTTVNLSGGGAAQSDPVAAENFIGAAADKIVVLRPPTAAAGVAMVDNAGLNLVAATAFTNPGTAAGVIRYAITYRVIATGL